MIVLLIFCFVTSTHAGPGVPNENYKDQFCTDPRTMRKHAAYTEWADAYSCTRHRCQPGGRNLAIYTVGCKRVEAPESAIECEEVVEDTNMQFPYCCTRLRCLVVVRGEVWTRVLGQPWETLPAAPWSHMYKMKKPPPGDTTFLPKSPGEGPIYELQTEAGQDKNSIMRSSKKGLPPPPPPSPPLTDGADYNTDIEQRAAPAPDIVIALSTNSDKKKETNSRYKRGRKEPTSQFLEDDGVISPRNNDENEEQTTEKSIEPVSDERPNNFYAVPQKAQPMVSWTEIPQNQWGDHDAAALEENGPKVSYFTDNRGNQPPKLKNSEEQQPRQHQPEYPAVELEKKAEKTGNLQNLVDAIGSRMKDIETVVQKMSEKVQKPKAKGEEDIGSTENKNTRRSEPPRKHKKKPNPDGEHYKRFPKHSKYLHDETTTEAAFVEDSNLKGYFSDASNTMTRPNQQMSPKEPAPTYMAPVENRRKAHVSTDEIDLEKKHKKHAHKKKHIKGPHHKKHHPKEDNKRKRFNRLNSMELDRNSLEDSKEPAAGGR